MTPTVSVLMPVYNAERYLAEAVESVLAQTFADFEFIIIDDGSTDTSLALLQTFAARDARIRLISRPNTGLVGALNEGLATARGEFVARMDADDVSLPPRLETQVAYLRSHPECVAVSCRVLLVDSEGAPLCAWLQLETHEQIDRAHLRGQGGAMVHPATLFRLKALQLVGGYRAETQDAEDLDLYLRLAEIGQLANCPQVLFHYRRHMLSVGVTRRERQARLARSVVLEALQRRGIKDESAAGDIDAAPVPAMSPAEYHRMWAWWAIHGGHIRSARKHAFAALRKSPWRLASWRVAYSAVRGR